MKLRPSVAIDLGTVSTRVSGADGDLIDEPSAIAVDRRTGAVAAVGRDADALAEKELLDIEVIHPVRDGVIADYEAAVAMLRGFLSRGRAHRGLARSRAVICVSGGATSLERRSLEAAVDTVLPRTVPQFVGKPVAAAAGAGLDLAPGSGAVIADIGGGTAEMAVLAGGHLVRTRSLRTGGTAMDAAVIRAVRAELGLLIGRDVARLLKMTLGLGHEPAQEAEVAGVDAAHRTPRVELVPAKLVAAALEHSVTAITGEVSDLLAGIPPSLAGDVVRGRIRLAGGGALLPGLAARIEAAAGIPAFVVDDPMRCVSRGAAAILHGSAAAAPAREQARPQPRPAESA